MVGVEPPLLNYSADVEEVEADSALVLHAAGSRFHTAALQLLLALVPPSAVTGRGKCLSSPLHWAVLGGDVAAAQLLVAANPDAAMVADSAGAAPLHLAAAKGATALMQPMLEAAPAAATCLDAEGWTPLQHAAVQGQCSGGSTAGDSARRSSCWGWQ